MTAAALALAAQGLFGLGWRASLLIGTALAPTDPAVVFSVLGRREVSGRSGTLLQGESGANDPVGIALMVSILGATGGGWGDVLGGVGEFALQMAVGIAIGAIGGYALLKVMRLPLPNERSTRCGRSPSEYSFTAWPRYATVPVSSPSSWPAS